MGLIFGFSHYKQRKKKIKNTIIYEIFNYFFIFFIWVYVT